MTTQYVLMLSLNTGDKQFVGPFPSYKAAKAYYNAEKVTDNTLVHCEVYPLYAPE